MTQNKLYATAIALVACLLGVGSTALHASFTNWGRQADMTAMYLLGTYMILYPLLRSNIISKFETVSLYLISNASLIYWLITASEPEQARQVFTALIVVSILVEMNIGSCNNPKWMEQNQRSRRVYYANGIMFALSLGQWKLSSSGGPLCDPDSLWQGHSLWHFTSAVGIGIMFLYYLYEEPVVDVRDSTTANKNKKDESKPPRVIRLVNVDGKKGTTTQKSCIIQESVMAIEIENTDNTSFDHSSNSSNTGDDDDDAWSE